MAPHNETNNVITSEYGSQREELGGTWYTFWCGDALPDLAPLEGFAFQAFADPVWIAQATEMDVREAGARLAGRHHCYIARMGEAVAGFGWSATAQAEIGELGLTLEMPEGNRYLWGFETLPGWRGRGVYSHLLQTIVRHEASDAVRWWIGHEPGNVASARGIVRAGFGRVGEIALLPGGAMELRGEEPRERAPAGAAILGVPLAQ